MLRFDISASTNLASRSDTFTFEDLKNKRYDKVESRLIFSIFVFIKKVH